MMEGVWSHLRTTALWTGVALVLGVAAMSGYFVAGRLVTAPFFLIQHVDIEGEETLSRDDVLVLTALDRPRSVLAWERREALARLRANPWVSSADLGLYFGDRAVRISITERQAVAVTLEGDSYWVDAAGDRIEIKDQSAGINVPMLLRSSGFDNDELPDLVAFMLSIAPLFPEDLKIREVHDVGLMGYVLVLSNGVVLEIGAEQPQLRVERALAAMERTPAEREFNVFRVVGRTPDRVVAGTQGRRVSGGG